MRRRSAAPRTNWSWRTPFAFASILVGCGGAGTPAASLPSSSQRTEPPASSENQKSRSPLAFPVEQAAPPADNAEAIMAQDVAGLTALDRVQYAKAREFFQQGKYYDAKRILGHLARSYRDIALLVAQYNTVSARIEQVLAPARLSLNAMPLRAVEPPPMGKTLRRAAPVGSSTRVRLVQKSSRPNGITDDERWYLENNLHTDEYAIPAQNDLAFAPAVQRPAFAFDELQSFSANPPQRSLRYRADSLPLEMAPAYGSLPLTKAIDSGSYHIGIYGERVIAVMAEGRAVALLDMASTLYADDAGSRGGQHGGSARKSPPQAGGETGRRAYHRIWWAQVRDGVLYVSNWNNGYAKEVRGLTGFISAIDLATGELLWRSDPLVTQMNNFLIEEGCLLVGYGFTAEPRFLFVLDRQSGNKLQTISLPTSAEALVRKDRDLYVRGYNRDFVFEVRSESASAVGKP